MRINIGVVSRPAGIALLAVTLSFCAWLCPDFGVLRKGFSVAEHPDPISLFILFSWYLLIFASLLVGQKLGALFSARCRATSHIPPLDSSSVYWTFTILAAIGTVYTFFRIFQSMPLLQAALYIYLGEANRLKNALYENYSAGLFSLRYLVLYSASLAIYRIVKLRKLSPLSIINLILLAATALISSRLILIATIVVSAFLLTYGKQAVAIRLVKLGIYASVLFAILSLLNFSRNSNFYAAQNLSFTTASVSEIVTYLGTPFHVALGAARRTDEITSEGPDYYREFIDVEEGLTTNSAFVQLHEQMGYASWPYIGVICCFVGFTFSWLTSFGRTSFLLAAGAILYAAAELWRLDLFQEGIFITWFVMGIGVPAALGLVSNLKNSGSRATMHYPARPAPQTGELPAPQV